jgi:copper oxidase (laccase) domain-containing protein
VVVVESPGEHAGAEADAAVTRMYGCTLAVRTADCCPVVLRSADGVGLVHAGWRGLVAGVVGAAVRALRELGPSPIGAELGPCIRAGCYEFGEADLELLAARFGSQVRGRTLWGTPSLDLAGTVAAALAAEGVGTVLDGGACTACTTRWFSHRARRESERFAALAWR